MDDQGPEAAGSAKESLILAHSGQAIVMDAHIARGASSDVFALASHPNTVLKMYHDADTERTAKLEAMCRNVPQDPQRRHGHVSLCWPDDLVVRTDRAVGWVMPRIDTTTHHPVPVFWDVPARAKWFPGFTWKYLRVAAANVFV